MDFSSFSSFYDKNSDQVNKIGLDLIDGWFGKGDSKPKSTIQPQPVIVQQAPSPVNSNTMYWVAGGIGVLLIIGFIAFRK